MNGKPRGVAIVLAMAVVLLAALTATALLVAQSTWSRRVELGVAHAQAQRLLLAGLDWSRAVLSDDQRLSAVDHAGEPWALRLPSMPLEHGSFAGYLEDQQGKFNLNNLLKDGAINPAELSHFRRLLSILELPPSLADALADWLDADQQTQPQNGAEDAHYLARQPPSVAGNRPLTDLAELALVAGFDHGVRERLRPFVTALPRFTAVNVNTASAEVLFAIIDGLSLDAARTVVAARGRGHFRNSSDFFRLLPAGFIVPYENIGVGSDYFIATLRVSVGPAQSRGSALLARERTGWPQIVWRKLQ